MTLYQFKVFALRFWACKYRNYFLKSITPFSRLRSRSLCEMTNEIDWYKLEVLPELDIRLKCELGRSDLLRMSLNYYCPWTWRNISGGFQTYFSWISTLLFEIWSNLVRDFGVCVRLKMGWLHCIMYVMNAVIGAKCDAERFSFAVRCSVLSVQKIFTMPHAVQLLRGWEV